MVDKLLRFVVLGLVLTLVGCSSLRNNDSIKNKYAGVDGSQALEMSSQIFGSEQMNSKEVKKMNKELMEINCRSVYFSFDSYNIKSDAKACLDKAASYLISHPDQPLKLSGNTDPRGGEKYNFNLGQRRANIVYEYLLSKGVNKEQLCLVSYGKLKLAADPSKFYDEFCTNGLNDSCMHKASEKAYYLDRRTDLDFGFKCEENNFS